MSDAGDNKLAVAEAGLLSELRQQIDALDDRLIALLDERLRIVLQVGKTKAQLHTDGDDATQSKMRPEREEAIFNRLAALSEELSAEAVRAIYREIISACMSYEQAQTVAYLGPAGTYSQQAVRAHFGRSAVALPCADIAAVVRAVETAEAHHGLLPLENSTQGMVDESYDRLTGSELTMTGEVLLPVRHCLLGAEGLSLQQVAKVYGHTQALAQCREWLGANLPNAVREPLASNALAAQRAAKEDNAVAVASEIAAEIYHLAVLQRGIQDVSSNTTRFGVVGHRPPEPTGSDKTSLLVRGDDRPGALLEILEIFQRHEVNLSMLYSRPSRQKNWSYVFYLDADGHRAAEPLSLAMQELRDKGVLLSVLGSYPRPPAASD